MNVQYTFKVNNINCYSTYQSLTNMAFNIWWDLVGTDSETGNSSYFSGNTYIPYDPDTEYVPYEQLTQSEVISWIEQYTDQSVIDEAKTIIEGRIEEASRPATIVNPKLPWE